MAEEGRPPSPGYEPIPYSSSLPAGIHATFTYISPGQQALHKKCPSPIKPHTGAPVIRINAEAGLPHALQATEIKQESSPQQLSHSSGLVEEAHSRQLRQRPPEVKVEYRDAGEGGASSARGTPSSLEDVAISSSPHASSASPTPRHALSRFGPSSRALAPDAGYAGRGPFRPAQESPDQPGSRRVRPRHAYQQPGSLQAVTFDGHRRKWHVQLPVSQPMCAASFWWHAWLPQYTGMVDCLTEHKCSVLP